MHIDFDWLEAHTFHRPLSIEERQLLEQHIRIEHAQKGDLLMREGEINDGIGLLRQGYAVVMHESHGEQVRIGDIREGAQFGDMSTFSGTPPSASIIAREASVIYRISHSALEQVINAGRLGQDIMSNTIRQLAGIVRTMNDSNAYTQQYIYGRRC